MLVWLVFLPLLGGLVGWLLDAYLQRSFAQIKQNKRNLDNSSDLICKLRDEFRLFSANWIALAFVLGSLVITGIFMLKAFNVENPELSRI